MTQCHLGSLDADKVDGRIVACARGANALVEKSAAVAEAGGVGMILYNVEGGADSILSVDHAIPTVHTRIADTDTIVEYLSSGEGTASLTEGVQYESRAPVMSDFSSTGPAYAGDGDLLKPDITAPGVDVVAAVAPPGNEGNDFASLPGHLDVEPAHRRSRCTFEGHQPGLVPLVDQIGDDDHRLPDDNQGDAITRHDESTATPFSYGSGHVQPGSMFDPGLVYDSGPVEWLQYGCAIDQFQMIGYTDLCNSVDAIDPSNLNYPSIAVGALAGSQEITRTVTNVSSVTSTYFPIIEAPEGLKVSVDKKSLTIRPGDSATFTLTVSRTDAAFNEYTFGSLTWQDLNGHKVRSPLVFQPVALATSSEVTGEGADGELDLSGVGRLHRNAQHRGRRSRRRRGRRVRSVEPGQQQLPHRRPGRERPR